MDSLTAIADWLFHSSGICSKATYQEIKDYIWEHYQTKVSHLYIAQIKKKCGLDMGENFNKPKTEGNKVPNCPPEKERMIREALEYFGMINKE